MKKNNLFKVIGLAFLLVFVLTWIIPAGGYSTGIFESSGISPLGIFNLARTPIIGIANMLQYAVYFLTLGLFYGVLNKTGVYTSTINSISNSVKRKGLFISVVVVLFAVISSFAGLSWLLFLLVPFICAILMKMGYSKLTSMLATVGSIIIGIAGATCSYEVVGVTNYFLGTELTSLLLVKILIFVLCLALYIFFVLRISKKDSDASSTSKKNSKKSSTEEESIPLFVEGAESKKSKIPFIVISILILIILFINMFNWGTFNITIFSELYTKMTSVKIGNFPILSNIIGNITSFGEWGIYGGLGLYDLVIFIVLNTFLIGWIYGLKLDEILDGAKSGMKEMLKPALCVGLASVVLVIMVDTSTGDNIFFSISNWILGLTKNFNSFLVTITSAIGSFFYNDFAELVSAFSYPISVVYTDTTTYPLIGVIVSSVYGLVSFIAPTSVLLIAGLSYFDISYKDWVKSTWKYLLSAFAIILVIVVIVSII